MNALKKLGIGLGIVAGGLLLGILALPLGLAITGAIFAYSAATGAGMATGASLALGAAGAVGGHVAGRFIRTSIGLGLVAVLKPTITHLVSTLKQSGVVVPSGPAPQSAPKPAPVKDPKDEFDAKAAVILKKDIGAPKLVWKTKPPSPDKPEAP